MKYKFSIQEAFHVKKNKKIVIYISFRTIRRIFNSITAATAGAPVNRRGCRGRRQRHGGSCGGYCETCNESPNNKGGNLPKESPERMETYFLLLEGIMEVAERYVFKVEYDLEFEKQDDKTLAQMR
ncbi:uncharacterized protein LOC105431886 [Pogonomyrmex barbatus]|uniref:Uncharacterized protein LOC105431886 n=1 Tax=Pogonomyrmex barbatus TaxID=144034 RepID=A0A6I9WR58_9HYME|nr:uncharacterized protein LOC105431886 [Pogonomyrmex barbatus]